MSTFVSGSGHQAITWNKVDFRPIGEVVLSWASCQICKIADCACAGNAANVFPTTAGQRSQHFIFDFFHWFIHLYVYFYVSFHRLLCACMCTYTLIPVVSCFFFVFIYSLTCLSFFIYFSVLFYLKMCSSVSHSALPWETSKPRGRLLLSKSRRPCLTRPYKGSMYVQNRDHFVYAPSQWETTLQCNVVSHWLGAYTKYSWRNWFSLKCFSAVD